MTNILRTIGEIVLTLSVGVASLFGFQASPPAPTPADLSVGATIPVNVAVFATSLQASITSSATSMTLVTGTNKAGSSLSGYICYNIDEGTTNEEFVCGSTTGTAVTSMIRGIDPVDGDLEVTALKKAHRRGASVKVTNYPSLAILARILNGDETLPNKLTYASAPTFSSGNELITKTYADALAIAGAPDASTTVEGITEEATTSEIDAGTAAGSLARLFVNPSALSSSIYNTRLPASGEKSALVGNNTDIAIGTGNKYVSQTGLQKQAENYAASATGNDTYVVTLSPVPTSLVNGMTVRFKPDTANTGAATLNVNSLGALSIVTGISTALVTGDIVANQVVEVTYNSTGTVWQLQNPASALLIPVTSTSGSSAGPASSSTQSITHGLGRIPKIIRLQGVTLYGGGASSGSPGISYGTYNATGNINVYVNGTTAGGATLTGSSTSYAINLTKNTGGTEVIATGVVGNVGATSFDIVWTAGGDMSASSHFIWETQ